MEKKGKVILFSPVGGTDPMPENYVELPNSNSDERMMRRDLTTDGSMIHIARMYRADRIILYLTQDMCRNERTDHRYTRCIQKLAEFQNRAIDCELEEREDLKDVHDFNFFYEEFGQLLRKIIEGKGEEDVLLLNISSGTPAMKSALLVLHNLWETECIPVQVVTPKRKMNEHSHREEYDPEEWWILNQDNCENPENRCVEVEMTNFMKLKKQEWIKKMLERYDYEAALDLAGTISGENSEYVSLLNLAKNRLLLNFQEVDRIYHQLPEEKRAECYIPFHDALERECFEYALSLDIKFKTGHYGDFIRAVSPIITNIFLMMIRQHLKVDVYRDLCEEKDREKSLYVWDSKKLKEKGNPNIERIYTLFYEEFKKSNLYFNDRSFPTSFHLFKIIELIEDQNVLKTARILRETENKLRNQAAHQIVSITRKNLHQKTGHSGEKILKEIKNGLQLCGFKIKQEDYASYDRMNQKIIESMESEM